MHELAIVQNLFRIVLEVAGQNKLKRITRVNFEVGEMQQIVPEYFAFAFDASKANSIASEAELHLVFIPIEMKCKSCQRTVRIRDAVFVCPHCRGSDLDLVHGNELHIKSIEGE